MYQTARTPSKANRALDIPDLVLSPKLLEFGYFPHPLAKRLSHETDELLMNENRTTDDRCLRAITLFTSKQIGLTALRQSPYAYLPRLTKGKTLDYYLVNSYMRIKWKWTLTQLGTLKVLLYS